MLAKLASTKARACRRRMLSWSRTRDLRPCRGGKLSEHGCRYQLPRRCCLSDLDGPEQRALREGQQAQCEQQRSNGEFVVAELSTVSEIPVPCCSGWCATTAAPVPKARRFCVTTSHGTARSHAQQSSGRRTHLGSWIPRWFLTASVSSEQCSRAMV
jgi:hypothetical protein